MPMEPESVTRNEFEKELRHVREEFEEKLEQAQNRMWTAVFGFVNGASARMERLESIDTMSRRDIAMVDKRVRMLERRAPRLVRPQPK